MKSRSDIMTTKKNSAAEAAAKQVEEAVENASAAFFQGYDEATAVNKESIEAFAKAGEVLTKGAEDVGKAYFDIAQASAEAGIEASKALMAAKSIKDVVDIQSEFARSSFDSFVAESTRLSEMNTKLATAAFAPLQAQLNAAFEKGFKFPTL